MRTRVAASEIQQIGFHATVNRELRIVAAYLFIAALLHKFTAGDILRMTSLVCDWRRSISHIPDFHLAPNAIKTLPH